MSAQIRGSTLKALAKITLDRGDAVEDAQSIVHLRPHPDEPDTHSVIEATNGRAIIWVTVAEPMDDARGVSRDHAIDHIGKDDMVLIDGGEVRSPVKFSLPSSRAPGSEFAGDTFEYPDLDEHRPSPESKVRLSGVDPKRVAQVLTALGAICDGSVEILTPRGGVMGFRGLTAAGLPVEAVLLEDNMFGPRATDMPGEKAAGGPGLFDAAIGRAVEALAPKPGSGIDSVTISTPNHSVTLTQEDGKRLRERGGRRAPKLAADSFGDGVDGSSAA